MHSNGWWIMWWWVTIAAFGSDSARPPRYGHERSCVGMTMVMISKRLLRASSSWDPDDDDDDHSISIDCTRNWYYSNGAILTNYGSLPLYCLLGATGKDDGRKPPTSFQINSCSFNRCNFWFSNEKSKADDATGSSPGLCKGSKKACFRAASTVMRLWGWMDNILRITSSASLGVPGNTEENGLGVFFGSFFMNRLAFSDVTKSSSASVSLPSFSEMMVSWRKQNDKQNNENGVHWKNR